MRLSLNCTLGGLALLVLASEAHGQDDLRDLRAVNAAQQQADIERQAALAVQREIAARQDQLQTALVLRELGAARSSSPVLAGPVMPLPEPLPVTEPDSLQLQIDRMERLTQDALARSQARIRGARPDDRP